MAKILMMLINGVVNVHFLSSHWSSSSSQFSLGSQEDLEEPLPLTTFHTENEHLSTRKAASMQIKAETHNGKIPLLGQNEEEDGEETACSRYLKMSRHHWPINMIYCWPLMICSTFGRTVIQWLFSLGCSFKAFIYIIIYSKCKRLLLGRRIGWPQIFFYCFIKLILLLCISCCHDCRGDWHLTIYE